VEKDNRHSPLGERRNACCLITNYVRRADVPLQAKVIPIASMKHKLLLIFAALWGGFLLA
jgi:hypothetical protein